MKKILLLLSVVLFSCSSDSPYEVEKSKDTSTTGYITEPTTVDGKLVDVTYKYDKSAQEFMTRFQNNTFERTYTLKDNDGHSIQYIYTIKFREVMQRKNPKAFPEEKLGLIEFYIAALLNVQKLTINSYKEIIFSTQENHSFTLDIRNYHGEMMLENYSVNYANNPHYIFIHYIDGNTIKLETNPPANGGTVGVYYKK